MKFKLSPNIAVHSQEQFAQAVNFYTNILGFQNQSIEGE